MVTVIKRNILRLGRWCESNQQTLLLLTAAVIMVFTLIWCTSLLVGYWLNGLYGMKFELSAAYGFLTIMVTGITTLGTMAYNIQSKYKIDSTFNSKEGELPKYGGSDSGG